MSKELFVSEVETLREQLSAEALEYFDKWKGANVEITEKGLNILNWMVSNEEEYNNSFLAKDIAEGLGLNVRSVPGTMRKLASEGFVDKENSKPCKYSVSEKGRSRK